MMKNKKSPLIEANYMQGLHQSSPKILIFYTSAVGLGHKKSAEAIKEAINHLYPKY